MGITSGNLYQLEFVHQVYAAVMSRAAVCNSVWQCSVDTSTLQRKYSHFSAGQTNILSEFYHQVVHLIFELADSGAFRYQVGEALELKTKIEPVGIHTLFDIVKDEETKDEQTEDEETDDKEINDKLKKVKPLQIPTPGTNLTDYSSLSNFIVKSLGKMQMIEVQIPHYMPDVHSYWMPKTYFAGHYTYVTIESSYQPVQGQEFDTELTGSKYIRYFNDMQKPPFDRPTANRHCAWHGARWVILPEFKEQRHQYIPSWYGIQKSQQQSGDSDKKQQKDEKNYRNLVKLYSDPSTITYYKEKSQVFISIYDMFSAAVLNQYQKNEQSFKTESIQYNQYFPKIDISMPKPKYPETNDDKWKKVLLDIDEIRGFGSCISIYDSDVELWSSAIHQGYYVPHYNDMQQVAPAGTLISKRQQLAVSYQILLEAAVPSGSCFAMRNQLPFSFTLCGTEIDPKENSVVLQQIPAGSFTEVSFQSNEKQQQEDSNNKQQQEDKSDKENSIHWKVSTYTTDYIKHEAVGDSHGAGTYVLTKVDYIDTNKPLHKSEVPSTSSIIPILLVEDGVRLLNITNSVYKNLTFPKIINAAVPPSGKDQIYKHQFPELEQPQQFRDGYYFQDYGPWGEKVNTRDQLFNISHSFKPFQYIKYNFKY